MKRERERPRNGKKRLCKRQADQPRQRQVRDLEVRSCVRTPVRVCYVDVRNAGDARADRERKPEISDDNVGSNGPEQHQVVVDVSAQRLGRENGMSVGQRIEKAIAGDRPDGADGKIEAREESRVAVVACELDVDSVAMQDRRETDRAAYVRERHSLGDE